MAATSALGRVKKPASKAARSCWRKKPARVMLVLARLWGLQKAEGLKRSWGTWLHDAVVVGS
jgi:hypothetical protein